MTSRLSHTALFTNAPPQMRSLEEAVLGAVMLEKGQIEGIADLFFPEVFYVDAHNKICTSILALHKSNHPIDILTVTDHLRGTGELENVGGAYYVTELTNRVSGAANVRYHLSLVHQAYLAREIIRISMEATKAAFEDTTDIFDLLSGLKKQLAELDSGLSVMAEVSLDKQITRTMEIMANASGNNSSVTGIPCGHRAIDSIINGFNPGELIIVAARSGSGKSAISIDWATHMASNNISVDFYSMEMADTDLIMRMIARRLNVGSYNVQRGKVSWKELGEFQDYFKDKPLGIQDTTRMWLDDVCDRIRMRKRNKGVTVAMIDYLQLLQVRGLNRNATRENEVSIISRTLKATAKDSGVAIIALSQLKRVSDDRADPRPRLSDLRDSGNLENDPDKIILIYRPEHHKIYYDADGYSTAGVALIEVAKNRKGELKETQLMWNGAITSFSDFPDDWKPRFEQGAVQKKKKYSPSSRLTPANGTGDGEEKEGQPF